MRVNLTKGARVLTGSGPAAAGSRAAMDRVPAILGLEAHDRPDPTLGYVHNCGPVPGARGRAPSPRQVPIIQFPYGGA